MEFILGPLEITIGFLISAFIGAAVTILVYEVNAAIPPKQLGPDLAAAPEPAPPVELAQRNKKKSTKRRR